MCEPVERWFPTHIWQEGFVFEKITITGGKKQECYRAIATDALK
jgi:hypothetical protein